MEFYVDKFILFLLMFLRCVSLIVTAPLFGHQSVPVQVKAGLGVFLAFVLFAFSAQAGNVGSLKLFAILVLAFKEILTGVSIGFAVGIIFAGIRFAGDIMAVDMGFSMAMMYDPETNASFPVLGELLYTFVILIFILLNGHHFILESLASSYVIIPIGTWHVSGITAQQIITMTGEVFVIAIKISAPVMISLFLVNISLGILNKAMPQMNIFGVLFPVKIGVGILVMTAMLPIIAFVFKKMLMTFESSIVEFMRVM
jgi:flagellar biosynthesis protein FliR